MNNPDTRRGGFALVIVLGMVVLTVSILVAFLLSTTTERNASNGFAASVSARQFGDTAVALIEAQINHATNSGETLGAPVAWTTQPGMLRTFGQDGNLQNLYKLYSADNMITTTPQDDADLPPATWTQNPALWVDLNARVSTGLDPTSNTESYVYPILDPRSLTPIGSGATAMPGLNNVGLTIDTTAQAFSGGTTTPDGITAAPMPVHWLYVLQDGTVVAPTAAGTNQVSITGDSTTNPVVGRVAFWTDDDTSKVNINTASEGTFWDTPHGYSQEEAFNFAPIQPARGEFQRYPGHPATVCMSSVFPSLKPEDIYLIAPRVTGDSEFAPYTGWTTKEGTQVPTSVSNPANTGQGVHSDGDRLYTSVDEMIFRAKRSAATAARDLTTSFTTSDNTLQTLTPSAVRSRRFFLTAHSRAPESNLFNLPRIATWPVFKLSLTNPAQPESSVGTADPQRTTGFDRLIALCSSTGPSAPVTAANGPTQSYVQPYFFQRELARDPNHDLGDFVAGGNSSILRNQQLYKYLQDLTSQQVPGFGGNATFALKYGTTSPNFGRDQILTEVFDYIRELNLYDDLLDYKSDGTLYSPTGQFTFTPNINVGASGASGHGLVTPITGPNGTMGEGRFFTLRALNLDLMSCAEYLTGDTTAQTTAKYCVSNNLMLCNPMQSGGVYTPLVAGQSRIQAMVLPSFFSTMVGWRLCNPDIRVEIDGLDQLAVKTVNALGIAVYLPLNLPASAQFQTSIKADPIAFGGGSGVGGPLGEGDTLYLQQLTRAQGAAGVPSTAQYNDSTGIGTYPFVGLPITVSNTSNSLVLCNKNKTANVQVTVKLFEAGDATGTRYSTTDPEQATSSQPTQTFVINIPSTTIPIPHPDVYAPAAATASDPMASAHYALSNTFYTDGSGLSRTAYVAATTTPPIVPEHTMPASDGRLDVATNGSLSTCWAYDQYVIATTATGGGTDVIRSLLPCNPNPSATSATPDWKCDYRLVAATHNVPATVFLPHPLYNSSTVYVASQLNSTETGGLLVTNAAVGDPGYPIFSYSSLGVNSGVTIPGPADATGDFDRPAGTRPGGASCNKPDEGDIGKGTPRDSGTLQFQNQTIPYYNDWNSQVAQGQTYFSPNRIIASPVMLGSLPTGVMTTNTQTNSLGVPWQTLLFRPPDANELKHVGTTKSPKDHLLLDLFWMPIVDPYAISDRYSTAGKINLNYRIIPFTYIERTTALRAALKAEKMARIPTTDNTVGITSYSTGNSTTTNTQPGASPYRYALDLNNMIQQFSDTREKNAGLQSVGKNVFISPSEICEMAMTPSGMQYMNMASDWTTGNGGKGYLQTGDNLREKVYATVYEKLTTKSNTFTVHFRAQALKRAPNSTAGTWTEGKDAILGEYRGSTTIERFIDPAATLPDYATDTASRTSKPLDYFYKWRVVENTQFAP